MKSKLVIALFPILLLTGCSRSPSAKQIQTDLLGNGISAAPPSKYQWRFESLSEFQTFQIQDTKRTPDTIQYTIKTHLHGSNGDDADASLLVTYRLNQNKWTFTSVTDTGDYTRSAEKLRLAKRTGQLTRDVAEEILAEYLVSPHISQLEFMDDGLQRAEKDGVVVQAGGFPPGYHFTEKGIQLLRGLVNANTRVELAPFGMEAPKFSLLSPVGEEVAEVSGIALGPVPNVCVVEYITNYLFPNEPGGMYPYIHIGRRAKTAFQKYDDGWRVAR